MTDTLLTSALDYAARGWYVLPLWGVVAGKCQCGSADCTSPGKHPCSPLVPRGLTQASNHADSIRHWWGQFPLCNVGVATGPGSGIVVIDIDPGHGGNYTMEELEAEIDFPATLTSQTGSGGTHLVYAYPAGEEVKSRNGGLGNGVDVKARGGYIVAPPSTHASGSQYAWELSSGPESGLLAELPDKLKARLTMRREPSSALAGEIEPGHRNQTLFDLAAGLRRHGSSLETISATLHMENSARCVPMLPDDEVDRIAASTARYEPIDPLLLHPERMLEYWLAGGPDVEGFELDVIAYLGEKEPEPESEEWLVQGVIPKSAPILFAGPPKSAKSIVTLDLAVAMALGVPWGGEIETKRSKVLYLSLEDSKTTTRRRVWQILRGHGKGPADVKGWLAIDSDHGFFFESDRYVLALRKAIEAFGPDVVLIDSLARCMTSNENSKEEMARVTVPWQELVREYGCTIGLIHHFKKARKEADGSDIPLGYRLRGSSDLFAFVRHVIGIEKVPDLQRTSRIETVGNYADELEPFAISTVSTETEAGTTLVVKHVGDPESASDSALQDMILTSLTANPDSSTGLSKTLKKRKAVICEVCSQMEADGLIFRASDRAPWRVRF